MIFYYIKNEKIKIINFDKQKVEIIENEDYFEKVLERNKHELWITYGQADYLKKRVSVYDCKTDKDIKYIMNSLCINDEVEAIVDIFFKNIDTYKCKLKLINEFNLPKFLLNSSIARITEYALGGKPKFGDDFNFYKLNILKKYTNVRDFFKRNNSYHEKYKTMVAGIEHTYGYGGCHAARKNYSSKKPILCIDVETFYPNLLNKFGYFNIKKIDRAKYIHEQNIKLKGEPERLPYKLADNSIVGSFKNQYSELYNPKASNMICVNGQLLITALIEMLEPYIKLVQTNTDGIIVEYDDFDKVDEICEKWEDATGLNLTFKCYDKIYQKDVNNYLLLGDEIKPVGELKQPPEYNYSISIIRHAIRHYLIENKSIRKTIYECDDPREFQILAKPSYKVYASRYGSRIKDVFSYKVTTKFEQIDKEWYINEAERRLKKYVV